MTNPLLNATTRRGTALRALGAAALASLAGLTLLAGPASAATQGLASSEWHGYVCDDGYYRIKTPFGQLVEKNMASSWGQVIQNPDTGGYNQQWKLCHYNSDNQSFIFRSRLNEDDCLGHWKRNPNDPNEGNSDGAPFNVFDCSGWIYGNQIFSLIHPSPGSSEVLLRIGHSGSFGTVADPAGSAGSAVNQYSYRATLFTLEHLAA
ncbi:RICIN domain-containing protein [Kitasatospora sp. NPDC059817]|uniref:RICIN domain-containing protein n=1 Tax=Kitasatospora sp. NPDC059817 TaxID=3346961 RepID=UPI00364CE6BB